MYVLMTITLGIKSLWVVISITIMGSFFGFVGMLIGAPLFSVLYTLVKEHTEKRLAKRNLPTETAAYADLNPLNVFEESVGTTPEHFTEAMGAALPVKAESAPEVEAEPAPKTEKTQESVPDVPTEPEPEPVPDPVPDATPIVFDDTQADAPTEEETEGEG